MFCSVAFLAKASKQPAAQQIPRPWTASLSWHSCANALPFQNIGSELRKTGLTGRSKKHGQKGAWFCHVTIHFARPDLKLYLFGSKFRFEQGGALLSDRRPGLRRLVSSCVKPSPCFNDFSMRSSLNELPDGQCTKWDI